MAPVSRNIFKFNLLNFECFAGIVQEIITVSIFLAQQMTTKTDLRCLEKLGHGLLRYEFYEMDQMK